MMTKFFVIGIILLAGIPIAVLYLLKNEHRRNVAFWEPEDGFADEPVARRCKLLLTVLGMLIILGTLALFIWCAFLLIP